MGRGLCRCRFRAFAGNRHRGESLRLAVTNVRLVIMAMVVGFFITLVLAWFHGEWGVQKVSGTGDRAASPCSKSS
ncbi:MAG: hypothetical protein M3Y69_05350 [Verrucomicrobiota bacterium]|nr:hypothetical protein [Verrucomicrobiota bacterium]